MEGWGGVRNENNLYHTLINHQWGTLETLTPSHWFSLYQSLPLSLLLSFPLHKHSLFVLVLIPENLQFCLLQFGLVRLASPHNDSVTLTLTLANWADRER